MLLRTATFLFAACGLLAAANPRIASFHSDATPSVGEPNIWVQPTITVLDPLFIKGVVLEDAGKRYVVAAIDWCGVGGSLDLLLRTRMAQAAGTTVKQVALQSIHQHTAPYAEGDGYDWMAKHHLSPLRLSDAYVSTLAARLEEAIRAAVKRLQPFDQIGTAAVKVERVAAMRRLLINGKIQTRYSSTAKTPQLAAEPEGAVDPFLRTITFARGGKPLVRLHYYATHPQTFCCDGRVTADFVGTARARLEKEEMIEEIYFTGAAGDVTVGKYNTGKDEERAALADRLYAAMKASAAATRYGKATDIRWRYEDLQLPKLPAPPTVDTKATDQVIYRDAAVQAFTHRTRPLPASRMQIGDVVVLHLPGEPMLEFQKYALANSGGRFLAFAGYGDISPGYLCTDEAFRQGGYEPSASRGAIGTEARVKEVIRKLLAR
ncbi:MAG: hypothetical protein HY820_10425 [Acidobacteria bacterium]|nr:hypothetical protein [Acidobacteriota bacterium]